MKRIAVLDGEKCIGCQSCMFACARRTGFGGLAHSRIKVRSAGGISRGFVVIVCRACERPSCASRCPSEALVPREGGGVRFRASKCVSCGQCVEDCPLGAVLWHEDESRPLICVACGACVPYCPYDVLVLEEEREG